jgi:hypothetical protein
VRRQEGPSLLPPHGDGRGASSTSGGPGGRPWQHGHCQESCACQHGSCFASHLVVRVWQCQAHTRVYDVYHRIVWLCVCEAFTHVRHVFPLMLWDISGSCIAEVMLKQVHSMLQGVQALRTMCACHVDAIQCYPSTQHAVNAAAIARKLQVVASTACADWRASPRG